MPLYASVIENYFQHLDTKKHKNVLYENYKRNPFLSKFISICKKVTTLPHQHFMKNTVVRMCNMFVQTICLRMTQKLPHPI